MKDIQKNPSAKVKARKIADMWEKIPAEGRPIPVHLNFWENKFKKIIAEKKDIKALILGVTPEFRDLLSKYKTDTICLDINPLAPEAMFLLSKERRNPNEKIVIGDWLKMPFADESFDVVLADCPHDNLPYLTVSPFFKEVNRVIKKGGYWFLASVYFRGYQEGITLDEYIEMYRDNVKNFSNIKFYAFVKVLNTKKYYDENKRIGDLEKIDRDLVTKYENKEINIKELKDLMVNADSLKKFIAMKFTWLSMNELLEIIQKNNLSVEETMKDEGEIGARFKVALILKKI